MKHILRSGQMLMELMVVMGLAAILLPVLFTGFVATRDGRVQQNMRIGALALLQETKEAVRVVREAGWSNISTNGTYHPVISGSTWILSTNAETVGSYTRSVVISSVNRDTNGAITQSGGTVDPSTKKIITTVSWSIPRATSITSTEYLTRYLENEAYTETTQTQFNAGTKTGVTVQATNPPAVSDDGEIVLGAGGHSDWCTPSLLSNVLDLPGSGYANSVTAVEGKAFAGTGENASGLSFMNIAITNTSPPVPSFAGTFDGYKTNDVFGETNYGYIATDTNSKEVVIIDLTTNPFTEAGYFNAPGNTSAGAVFVSDNVGYMGTSNKFYTFNLSSKSGSRPILDADGVTMAGVIHNIMVVGNYAYVIVEQNSPQLQIVDVSNPNNLTIVGQATLDAEDGKDVFVNATGTRAYVVTQLSTSKKEFFIVDVSTKTGNRPTLGSYEGAGIDPKGVTVVPGNRAIMVGLGGEEYQILNISNEANPTRCGGAQVDAGINGVSSVLEADGDAYSYIVTSDADREFRIVEGGPGGSYASSGTFESATFNPGYQTANNRFSATYSAPANTTLQFQVSMANLVGGSCPSTGGYTFVGPDGTSNTQYNQSSGTSVPFPVTSTGNYSNPGQCMRYKMYFTGNGAASPVLQDVTLNYSP